MPTYEFDSEFWYHLNWFTRSAVLRSHYVLDRRLNRFLHLLYLYLKRFARIAIFDNNKFNIIVGRGITTRNLSGRETFFTMAKYAFDVVPFLKIH